MRGLYNAVIADGREEMRGEVLLPILGLPYVGRFRDVWVERGENGEPIIAIYTRNGGDNREAQAKAIEIMRANPHYVSDRDDTFDNTYAAFYFSAPKEHEEFLRKMMQDPIDTDQRWRDAIARLDTLGADELEAMTDRIMRSVHIIDVTPDTKRMTDEN